MSQAKMKERTSVYLVDEAKDAIRAMQGVFPYMSANAIINHVIVQYYESLGGAKNPKLKQNEVKTEMEEKEEREARAKKWAEKYGATVSAHHTMYMKYEKTFGGEVVKNKRATPVEELPTTEDGVRRLILGPFANVEEAEAAFANQNTTTGAGSKKKTEAE